MALQRYIDPAYATTDDILSTAEVRSMLDMMGAK
jgi:hypothetical protein